jgi:hypothetical protein
VARVEREQSQRVPVDRSIGSVGGVVGGISCSRDEGKEKREVTHTHHSLSIDCKHSLEECQVRVRTETMVAAGAESTRRWAAESR